MKPLFRLTCLSVTLMLILVGATTAQPRGFYLKENDRVVFYGDSITEQRLYTTFIETYVRTRFPQLNVGFVNSGWGGDWVVGGGGGKMDERVRRDILAHRPTVVTAMFGMNDAAYQGYDEKLFKVYTDGYRQLITRLKTASPDLRFTLLQPSPFDDVTAHSEWRSDGAQVVGGYNAVLIRYGEFVRELAREEKLNVVDLNAPLINAIKQTREVDADIAAKIIPDRIHPAPAGSLLMAAAILEAWHAPAVVTEVEIDVANVRVGQAVNTELTKLNTTSGSLTWTQKDGALPMPLDARDRALMFVASRFGVIEKLNQQRLRITGLTAARYALKIDNVEVGVWTKEELAQGVNLAVQPTPMHRQAMTVHDLTLKRNAIRFARWREVQVPLQSEHASVAVERALAALDALEAELIKQQRLAAQPQPRRYELIEKTN